MRPKPGMREDELAAVEATYGFGFPPDLRSLLATEIPAGWFDWRDASPDEIQMRLEEPIAGVAPYFQNYEYWLPPWGPRPDAVEDRIAFLRGAPRLIPLVGQHYLAAEPCAAGNPVFSIFGIDMIVAGCDLADRLAGGVRSAATKGEARHIRFWSDVLYIHWDGWLPLLMQDLARLE